MSRSRAKPYPSKMQRSPNATDRRDHEGTGAHRQTVRIEYTDEFSIRKEGTTMNAIDRIILSSLAFGIWAWLLITFLQVNILIVSRPS